MNTLIIYVFLVLSIDIFLLSGTFVLYLFYKEYKRKNDLEQLEMNLNFTINEDDLKIIDDLVSDAFNHFCFINYDKMNQEYINTQVQQEAINEVLKTTLLRLSPVYMNKLSYIYNRNYIEDLILEKTQIVVIDYCVKVNGSLES